MMEPYSIVHSIEGVIEMMVMMSGDVRSTGSFKRRLVYKMIELVASRCRLYKLYPYENSVSNGYLYLHFCKTTRAINTEALYITSMGCILRLCAVYYDYWTSPCTYLQYLR